MLNPLVSICCLAYNHEPYIRECLNGFMMQKTDFQFEVLIHDDASSDKTVDIIREFEVANPEIIRPIYQTENQYSKGIGVTRVYQFPRARGKYIAMCEGDDYWIDPYKLQKQVDFLEKNPDYGMVCTNYNKYYQKEERFEKLCFSYTKYKDEVSFEDYIFDRTTISTATVIFRSSLITNYLSDISENERNNWKVGDTPLWLYIAIVSKIKVLPDVTAVYRINQNSASKFTDVHEKYQFRLKGYEIPFFFIEYFGNRPELKEKMEIAYNNMFIRYRYESKDINIGVENYWKLKKMKALSFDSWIRYNFSNHHFLAKYCLFPANYIFRKIKKFFK